MSDEPMKEEVEVKPGQVLIDLKPDPKNPTLLIQDFVLEGTEDDLLSTLGSFFVSHPEIIGLFGKSLMMAKIKLAQIAREN